MSNKIKPLIYILCLLFVISSSPVFSQDINVTADEKEPTEQTSTAEHQQRVASVRELSAAFRTAAQQALPCIVTVYARKAAAADDKMEQIDSLDFLEADPDKNYNIGSGVILSAEGLIVTNNHVVEGSKRIRVRMPDGREFPGADMKSDPSSDLAVLKIATPNSLPFLKLGDSNILSVGDWVLAIGSPFAIEQTVSAGIISGKSRSLRGLVAGPLLQTDAAINPGNSGGALVNLDAELVGINTAIASTSGSFQGVGFSIPASRVKWITEELEKYGRVRRATMGVTTAPLPQEIAEQLDLPTPAGAIVIRIRDKMPADIAGLKKGDIIRELADQTVRSPADLASIVEQLPTEQPLKLSVVREGSIVDLEITLRPKDE